MRRTTLGAVELGALEGIREEDEADEGGEQTDSSAELTSVDVDDRSSVLSPITPLGQRASTEIARRRNLLESPEALLLTKLEELDAQMPFRPLCGRCNPIRPFEILPMQPEVLSIPVSYVCSRDGLVGRLADACRYGRRRSSNGAGRAQIEGDSQAALPGSEKRKRTKSISMKRTGAMFSAISLSRSSSPAISDHSSQFTSDSASEHETQAPEHIIRKRSLVAASAVAAALLARSPTSQAPRSGRRLQRLRDSLRQTSADIIVEPARFTACASLEEVVMPQKLCRSRFSRTAAAEVSRNLQVRAPVLLQLSEYELGVLELWAYNHVKSQYLRVCAVAHNMIPKRVRAHKLQMVLASVYQLQHKLKSTQYISPKEREFLLASMSQLPVLKNLPDDVLRASLPSIEVKVFSQGDKIIRQGQVADGMYVLLQGEALLCGERAENEAHIGGRRIPLHDQLEEAPYAIQMDDLIEQELEDTLVLKEPVAKRKWSRTVLVPLRADANSTAITIFLPLFLLIEIHDDILMKENKELTSAVTKVFAPSMHLGVSLCNKHIAHFTLRKLQTNQVVIQSGLKPPLTTALVSVIIEGEVSVHHARGQAREAKKYARKESTAFIHQKSVGDIIGDDALYGDAYTSTVLVKSETLKIVSITAQNYLSFLLHRSEPLARLYDNKRSRRGTSEVTTPVDLKPASEGTWKSPDWSVAAEFEEEESYALEIDGRKGAASIVTSAIRVATKKPKHSEVYEQASSILANSRKRDKALDDRRTLLKLSDRQSTLDRRKAPCQPDKVVIANAMALLSRDGDAGVCYPPVSPDAKRKAMALAAEWRKNSISKDGGKHRFAGAPPLSSLSMTSTSASTRSEVSPNFMDSLTQHIAVQTSRTVRLEAEHNSHCVGLFHVEDLDGRATHCGRMMAPSLGASLLFSIGTARPSTADGSTTLPFIDNVDGKTLSPDFAPSDFFVGLRPPLSARAGSFCRRPHSCA